MMVVLKSATTVQSKSIVNKKNQRSTAALKLITNE